jgi:hypothetical protein
MGTAFCERSATVPPGHSVGRPLAERKFLQRDAGRARKARNANDEGPALRCTLLLHLKPGRPQGRGGR